MRPPRALGVTLSLLILLTMEVRVRVGVGVDTVGRREGHLGVTLSLLILLRVVLKNVAVAVVVAPPPSLLPSYTCSQVRVRKRKPDEQEAR